MNPDDSAEADEALGRIRDLCQKLEARDKDDLDEVIETTGKAVEEKSLRFGRGARVVSSITEERRPRVTRRQVGARAGRRVVVRRVVDRILVALE